MTCIIIPEIQDPAFVETIIGGFDQDITFIRHVVASEDMVVITLKMSISGGDWEKGVCVANSDRSWWYHADGRPMSPWANHAFSNLDQALVEPNPSFLVVS